MLRSETLVQVSAHSRSRAGYSLFEVMIVLSILTIVVAIAAAGFRPPSDELKLNRQVAHLVLLVGDARLKAIRSKRLVHIEVVDCANEHVELIFFPDGTASSAEFCLAEGEQREILVLRPLTGQISTVLNDE
ncbi:prepilin-type N-terminal cleavage/methylation domain-containing protein [Ruegeria sp. SCPT10]|uniref:pilus assembly FimT family protein n=1 Tax=Ruegeria sp. SCP10 TaxID=3141377 RepID=UPI003337755E